MSGHQINRIDLIIILICASFVGFVYMQRNKYAVVKESKGFHHPSMFEISGIEQDLVFKNYIWSHNDSGDQARLFLTRIPELTKKNDEFKDFYEIKVEHDILPTQNVDWEDIALSDQRFLYVGDIGNNFQWRKDLMVYRIDLNQQLIALNQLEKTKVLKADGISFEYPDQLEFPPLAWEQRKFDAEAMMVKDERLYLINKAFMGGESNEISIYSFPPKKELDRYIEQQKQHLSNNLPKLTLKLFQRLTLKPPVDRMRIHAPLSLRVTAADYLKPYLAILCYEYIFLFKWEHDQISPEPSAYLKLSNKTYQQVEALSWIQAEGQEPLLMIANEQRRIFYIKQNELLPYPSSEIIKPEMIDAHHQQSEMIDAHSMDEKPKNIDSSTIVPHILIQERNQLTPPDSSNSSTIVPHILIQERNQQTLPDPSKLNLTD
jgi:hypothetical protein